MKVNKETFKNIMLKKIFHKKKLEEIQYERTHKPNLPNLPKEVKRLIDDENDLDKKEYLYNNSNYYGNED